VSQSLVEQSGKVRSIASLMRQLLEEVRVAPVGVAARARVAEIHGRSVSELERGLALDVVDELEGIALPFCGQERFDAGLGVAQGRRVSRVDRLLDNIESAQFGQQGHRLSKVDAGRASHAATLVHPVRVVPTRSAEPPPYDDPSNYLG